MEHSRKKKTPMFASKNSLMQQSKNTRETMKKKMLLCVILQHIHFVIYPTNIKIRIKNHVTTLNKTNVPDDIFLSHRPLQKDSW